ncbi:MAG: flagellar basal body rod protein FlgC [Rhodothalassiaceae bacterium]
MTANAISTIALSGLAASRRRIETAASNLVNIASAGTPETVFKPQRTVLAPAPGGGVRAGTKPLTPAFTTIFAPDHPDAAGDGSLAVPNIFAAGEIVEIRAARAGYEASLRLLRVADERDARLLDIFDDRKG